MSGDDVEVVRRIYEAGARRDAAAVLDLHDRDVELDASRRGVLRARGIYRGHDGLVVWFPSPEETPEAARLRE